MQTKTVILAGKEYTLEALPIRQAREFRKKFAAPLEGLISALQKTPTQDLTDLEAVGALLGIVKNVLIGSIDMALEILFAYSSEIATDREHIEAEAYDEEALGAFLEVIKLLYPFGRLASILPGPPR